MLEPELETPFTKEYLDGGYGILYAVGISLEKEEIDYGRTENSTDH
jgi:hypothetical protein